MSDQATVLDLLKAMRKEIYESKSEKGIQYFIGKWQAYSGGNPRDLEGVAQDYFSSDSGKLAVIRFLDEHTLHGAWFRDDEEEYQVIIKGTNHSRYYNLSKMTITEARYQAALWLIAQKGEKDEVVRDAGKS